METCAIVIDHKLKIFLIYELLAQRLYLPWSRFTIAIFGVNSLHSGCSKGKIMLSCNLTSKISEQNLTTVVFILLHLYQETSPKSKIVWLHIKNLQLADSQFITNNPNDLLFHAEVFYSLKATSKKRSMNTYDSKHIDWMHSMRQSRKESVKNAAHSF